LILESLLLVSGPMSFCPNISDRIVSCFTFSVNQSSQFTSSVDPVAPYPILGTSRLCREIKNGLSGYDLATLDNIFINGIFLDFV
jgi:hypothetical protein